MTNQLMPKNVLIFLVLSFTICIAHAQTLTDDLLLTTQAEVEAFNYSEVTGDLIIEGADIVDLTSLSVLTNVGGDLVIQNNTNLIGLDGLLNLTDVGEDIDVSDNPLIINLNALINLNSAGGNIVIENNVELLNLDGLKNITSANGYLKVRRNVNLENLRGLQNITSVGGSLEIYNNDAITTLDGLEAITFVDGYLEISGNDELTNLIALENISDVVGRITISNNDKLMDLEGLQNIEQIKDKLEIDGNDELTNLNALQNISSTTGNLEISNNDALLTLNGLHNVTSVGESLQIYGNDGIINLEGLENITTIDGSLEIDNNDLLESLEGLQNLLTVTGDLNITENALLSSFCDIYPLLNDGGLGGVLTIVDNEFNPTSAEIIANGSCEKENTEPVIPDDETSKSLILGEPVLTGCGTYEVAVMVNDFIDVGTVSLKLTYNQTELTYTGVELNPAISTAAVNGAVAGKFSLAYFGETITLEDDEALIVLKFSVIPKIEGTPFNISWGTLPGDCEIAGLDGEPVYSCNFVDLDVEVVTDELPEIECLEDIVANNDEGECGAIVTFTPPVGTDNCDNPNTMQVEGLESGDEFPVGTTINTFEVTDSQGNTAECSFTVTIVDNEVPTITTCAPDQSAVVTDGCSVEMPDFVSTVEAEDNCGVTSITQNPPIGKYMEFQETPYEVVITVADEAGNETTCTSLFSVEKAQVSGVLKYNNTAQTTMNNITLSISPYGDNETCTTDDDGNYSFTGLCAGTYSIIVTNNPKPVGYINATDAGAVNKWGTTSREVEYVNFLAADVAENDLYINSTDALGIQNYFVYETSFDRVPWSYWSKGAKINSNVSPYPEISDHPENITVEVGGSNVNDFDIYALCTGDFNGSFTPLKSARQSLHIDVDQNQKVAENKVLEYAFRAGVSMEVGAISMILNVPSEFVEVRDVKIQASDVIPDWNIKGDELRIGWNSLDPVLVYPDEKLIILQLKTSNDFELGSALNIDLVPNPLNELADGNFDVIDGARLKASKVVNNAIDVNDLNHSIEISLNNFPNPFNNSTEVHYNLPFSGNVNLSLYNNIGQLVDIVIDSKQDAGKYIIDNYGSDLETGIYILKISLTNQSDQLRSSIKLKVIR